MVSKPIVTFVFSDIEHSTRLAQQLQENYPRYLERHRSVIRETITKYEGREIDAAGDGFFMTFNNALSAIRAAADIQTVFHTHKWAKKIGLKVRMGIHTGVGLLTESGYTGVQVHLASRICNAAHGGQVLISSLTRQHLGPNPFDGFSLSSLGEFTLKDFAQSVELIQLNISGINSIFPNPRVNPEEKRIAVLPFANMSKNTEHEYIGDGIAEEVIVALGKIPGLRVASRKSTFALKNVSMQPQQIGQKLDVNSVLDGRVDVINGHTRISVELVDSNTGLNIWSGQYDSAKKDLLQMRREITSKIISALEFNLFPHQVDALQQRQTFNAEAYDYYLRGRRFYLQFSSRSMELALQMFKKAIEADKTYALAYAGIADCYSFQFQHEAPLRETIDKADVASEKAISLAPEIAEVYVSRGIVQSLRGQFDKAGESFQYAVEREPTLFLGWYHYGRACFAAGKLDKAARLFEQANRVEPDDYQSIFLAAQSYSDVGSADLAYILRERGVGIAEKWLDLNPADTRALYLAANALVFLNQREKSRMLLQRALLLEPDDSMLLYNAGCVYALLGMKLEALSCLERSYAAGLTLLGWYENDSNLDTLRNEPRFIRLIEQIKEKIT
jgi:adenylate cyclase